ncbi:DNA repair protein rhp54 [Hordeum vulgare]|nr:DNA repair protein rhp54 [Hordeum vulgare]
MPADMLSRARNLFDRMLAVVDDDRVHCFMQSIIFKGDAAAAAGAATVGYDPKETQSQDDRRLFTLSTFDQVGM